MLNSPSEGPKIHPLFQEVSELNDMYKTKEPTNIEEYHRKGLSAPRMLTYAIGNGVVAACDEDGWMHAAMKPKDKNELAGILSELRKQNYEPAEFYVPVFFVQSKPAQKISSYELNYLYFSALTIRSGGNVSK